MRRGSSSEEPTHAEARIRFCNQRGGIALQACERAYRVDRFGYEPVVHPD